jgi:hypothetical protein
MGQDEFLVPGYVAFIGRVLETFRHDRSHLFEDASVNQCPLALAIWLTVYGLRALGKEANSVELVSRTGITRQRIAEICSILVERGFLERYTVGSVHPTRSGYYYAVPARMLEVLHEPLALAAQPLPG